MRKQERYIEVPPLEVRQAQIENWNRIKADMIERDEQEHPSLLKAIRKYPPPGDAIRRHMGIPTKGLNDETELEADTSLAGPDSNGPDGLRADQTAVGERETDRERTGGLSRQETV